MAAKVYEGIITVCLLYTNRVKSNMQVEVPELSAKEYSNPYFVLNLFSNLGTSGPAVEIKFDLKHSFKCFDPFKKKRNVCIYHLCVVVFF